MHKSISALLLLLFNIMLTHASFGFSDLWVRHVEFVGEPKIGACNKLQVIAQNIGGWQTPSVTATHTLTIRNQQGEYFKTSKLTHDPIYRWGSVRLNFNGFPLQRGVSTLSVVLDEQFQIPEFDLSNNAVRRNVIATQGCEEQVAPESECTLRATFLSPSGYKQEGGSALDWEVELENVGSGECPREHVQLRRGSYKNNSSNSSVAVGNQILVPALGSGETYVAEWRELFPPNEGQFLYKVTSTGSLIPNSRLVLFE